jgi:hypothetical protein
MGEVGNLMNLELRMQSAFAYAMADKNLESAGEKALFVLLPGYVEELRRGKCRGL